MAEIHINNGGTAHITIHEGQKPDPPESITERQTIGLKPSTKERLQAEAARRGIGDSTLGRLIIEWYLDNLDLIRRLRESLSRFP